MVLELKRRAEAFLAVIVGAALLVLVAVGCGAAPAQTPTPPPTERRVDSGEVVQKASAALAAVDSAGFVLEHLSGATELIPGLVEVHKFYGVVDTPDKVQVTMEGMTIRPASFVKVDVIAIGDTAYMTDFITGSWREVPIESLPFLPTNLNNVMAEIVAALEQPTLVGPEQLGDTDTYHVRGNIKSQELGGLIPRAEEGFDVAFELWVDRSSYDLVQALLSGQVVSSDPAGTVRQLTLYDINVPVDISPPE